MGVNSEICQLQALVESRAMSDFPPFILSDQAHPFPSIGGPSGLSKTHAHRPMIMARHQYSVLDAISALDGSVYLLTETPAPQTSHLQGIA